MRRLWVIGDSWTDPSYGGWAWACGWPQRVADALGLGLVNSGSGGSGYAAVNASNVSHPIQAARGAGAGADVVVLFGSVNDQAFDPAYVRLGAERALRMVRAACPAAAVIVAGPQYWDAEPPAALYPVRAAVARAAAEHPAPVRWLDPLRWLRGRPELLDAQNHPTCDGHALLAASLAPAVADALTRTDPTPDPGGWLPLPLALPGVFTT